MNFLYMNNTNYEPADIIIYIFGKGMVLSEKSLVALDTSGTKILAYGAEAQQMAMEKPENVHLISPLRQGMIADYLVSVNMFTHFLRKAIGKRPLRKPPIAVCVPKGMTEVEKKALEDAIIQSGARELFIADVPVEELISAFPEKFPKLYKRFKIIISITKEQPEHYVTERLQEALNYAGQEGISPSRVSELFQNLRQDS